MADRSRRVKQNENGGRGRRFVEEKRYLDRSIVVMGLARSPEDSDASIEAVWENIVRRQRHERMIVARIDGHRMRGSRRMHARHRGNVERRHNLDECLT